MVSLRQLLDGDDQAQGVGICIFRPGAPQVARRRIHMPCSSPPLTPRKSDRRAACLPVLTEEQRKPVRNHPRAGISPSDRPRTEVGSPRNL